MSSSSSAPSERPEWVSVRSGSVQDEKNAWVEEAPEHCGATIYIQGVGEYDCREGREHTLLHECQYNYGRPERFMILWDDSGNFEIKKKVMIK